MWLINVVIIITFVYYMAQIISRAIRKRDPILFVIIGLAIFFESIFLFNLADKKEMNNIMQALTLIFAYIIPILVVTLRGFEKEVKITIVYCVARFMYLIKNYEFAEGLLSRIMVKARKAEKVYYLRAKSLEKLERYAEARDVLINSLSINNENAEVYYEIGRLLDKLGNKEAAISMFNQAVTIDNTYVAAKEMLGILFSDMGLYKDAKAIYEDIAITGDATEDTFFNLAVIYSALGEVNKAVSAYEKALELNDKMYEAYYSVGRLYYALEQYTTAKECFEKALIEESLKPKAEYSLAMVSIKMGDIKDAISHLTIATSLDEKYILTAKKDRLFKVVLNDIYKLEEKKNSEEPQMNTELEEEKIEE